MSTNNEFSRAFVETLRKEAGAHRTKNKILVKALLTSECARAGIVCGPIDDTTAKGVTVDRCGNIHGIAEVLSKLTSK